MLLMPNTDWQWIYNEQRNCLTISLGEEYEFLTPYCSRVLIPDALTNVEFDCEHAQYYIAFIESLQSAANISSAQKVQMALNATAAYFLLKPQMPKSWFFKESSELVYPKVGKVCSLQLENEQKVAVVVIEAGIQASVVLMVHDEVQLSSKKSLSQFDAIKVMNNRLQPLKRSAKAVWVAA
ncbi:cell division protein ZapC [Paraferrimonas haliotis]|uniref:Cell division protein ZapC n=1 Tax=Paraferrimonas haliotis TaxID=2013866 RepID=A0AA37TN79_9GAMM|nr:cell division protein ZapC [Paraferrimonas haliotis]GLS84622.1 cell division protein ZapC [Paraferrimonas haliotis]